MARRDYVTEFTDAEREAMPVYEAGKVMGAPLNIAGDYEEKYKKPKMKLKKRELPQVDIPQEGIDDTTVQTPSPFQIPIANIKQESKLADLEEAAAPEQNVIQEMFDVNEDETTERLAENEMQHRQRQQQSGAFPWFTALAPIVGGAIGGSADIGAGFAGDALLKEEGMRREDDKLALKQSLSRALATEKVAARTQEKAQDAQLRKDILGIKHGQTKEIQDIKQEGRKEILGKKLEAKDVVLGKKLGQKQVQFEGKQDLAERKLKFSKTAHGDKMQNAAAKLAEKIKAGKAKQVESWNPQHPKYTKFVREKALPKFQAAVKDDREAVDEIRKIEAIAASDGVFQQKLLVRSIAKMVEKGRLSDEDIKDYAGEYSVIESARNYLIKNKTNRLPPHKLKEVKVALGIMKKIISKNLGAKAQDTAKAYFLNNPELSKDTAKRFMSFAGLDSVEETPVKAEAKAELKDIGKMTPEEIDAELKAME